MVFLTDMRLQNRRHSLWYNRTDFSLWWCAGMCRGNLGSFKGDYDTSYPELLCYLYRKLYNLDNDHPPDLFFFGRICLLYRKKDLIHDYFAPLYPSFIDISLFTKDSWNPYLPALPYISCSIRKHDHACHN